MTLKLTDADPDPPGSVAAGPFLSIYGMSLADSVRHDKKESFSPGQEEEAEQDRNAFSPPAGNATFNGGQELYIPIDKYEGRHRYDPEYRWQAKAEKKLVRKVCNHTPTTERQG